MTAETKDINIIIHETFSLQLKHEHRLQTTNNLTMPPNNKRTNNPTMPSNNRRSATTPSDSEKKFHVFEALLVLSFLPAAFATYKVIQFHLIKSDPPIWVVLMVLGFFVSLVLVLVTPKQKWTTITLGLELAGATVLFPGE